MESGSGEERTYNGEGPGDGREDSRDSGSDVVVSSQEEGSEDFGGSSLGDDHSGDGSETEESDEEEKEDRADSKEREADRSGSEMDSEEEAEYFRSWGLEPRKRWVMEEVEDVYSTIIVDRYGFISRKRYVKFVPNEANRLGSMLYNLSTVRTKECTEIIERQRELFRQLPALKDRPLDKPEPVFRKYKGRVVKVWPIVDPSKMLPPSDMTDDEINLANVINCIPFFEPILVDSVITIGPSLDCFPLCPMENPKFMLYYLNKNLLQHTIRYLAPSSRKIFIFCINEYEDLVRRLIKGVTNVPIELIMSEGYDGMGFVINMLRVHIETPTFILCKPDQFHRDSLDDLLRNFQVITDDDVHFPVYHVNSVQPTMFVSKDQRLYVYDRERIAKGKADFLLTNELKLKNFYIMKKSVIDMVSVESFGFKRTIISGLLKKKAKIRLIRTETYPASTLEEFAQQLYYKNMLFDGPPEVLYGYGVTISSEAVIKNSIVGDHCRVGANSLITDCIFMPDVVVEDNCILTNCIIGANTVIVSGSRMIDCKIANDYKFTSPPDVKGAIFSYE